jgi:hypothetical protein
MRELFVANLHPTKLAPSESVDSSIGGPHFALAVSGTHDGFNWLVPRLHTEVLGEYSLSAFGDLRWVCWE